MRAIRWRFAGTAIGAGSQLAIGTLLARLLSPTDYGLVAVASIIIGFARLFGDLGIGSAIVQRQSLTVRHVRAAFTLSTLLGIAVAAMVASMAPLAARVVADSHATSIVRALSFGFAIAGTSVAGAALLRRDVKFKQLFFIETISYTIGYGGLAMLLAWNGYAAWSLVWGNLLQTFVASAAVLAVSGHSTRPLLTRAELSDLLRFGVGAHLSGCANYVALQGDNFVVGRALGAFELGLYSRAYTLMNLPFTYAAAVISGVLFPVFAQMQAAPARLRPAFVAATQATAVIAASGSVVIGIASPHLVPTLYGAHWAEVVPPLQVLCIAGYFRALYHLGGIAVQSVGWVYSELRNQIVYAVLVVTGAAIGARAGLVGVAIGVDLAIIVMFVATNRLALRAVAMSWRRYGGIQLPAIATSSVAAAVAFAVRLWLESLGASSAIVVLSLAVAAAVPTAIGSLWIAGGRDLEPIRAALPPVGLRLVEILRKSSRMAAVRTANFRH